MITQEQRLQLAGQIMAGIMANPEVNVADAFLNGKFLILKGGPGQHYEDNVQSMYADLALGLADAIIAKL